MFRVGCGYDVHRLCENRELILGGVKIPHDKGLDGHSDADVLVHSIMDALLGAVACGDIGKHFPDSDNSYKDACSIELLKAVSKIVKEKGYIISNIDSTIVAQKPRLASYIEEMRCNIADALCMNVECVSIKATTTERLGFEGEELGISAQAVCAMYKIGE